MKPLSLTMQAFGSYLQKTEIDFSLLGDGTIFLITGSTGGGKTTILDAMCFALYCRSTGGHRSWDEMRCTAAPDDLPTLLDFSFRLGSETYRFFRKRQAYRKRGSGERAFREEHSCYRLSGGEWELIETGAETRIRERAQELLHLTCEQFSQVIVLPQGEFLRLLRANSVGKAEILKTLFATGLWQEIARAAKSRADTLAARAGEIRAARASLLEREGVPDADGLSAKLASLRKEIADREEESALLSGSLQKEEAAFAAAKLLEQKFRELSDAQRQAARLESEKPAQALREKTLQNGRRLRAVLPYAEAAQSSDRDAAEKDASFRRAGLRCRDLRAELESARRESERIPGLRTESAQLAQKAARLEESLGSIRRLSELERGAAEIRQKREDSAVREKGWSDRLREAGERIAAGEEYVRSCEDSLGKLADQKEDVRLLTEQKANQERLTALEREWTSLAAAHREAEEAERIQSAKLAALRRQLSQAEQEAVSDAASWMAARLEDGKPCPVCGALHHPAPHTAAGAGIDPHQLDDLRAAASAEEAAENDCLKRLSQAKAAADQKQAELSAQRELCRGLPEAAKIAALLPARQQLLEKLQKEAGNLPAAKERLQKLRANQQAAQSELEACRKESAACDAELSGTEAAIRELRAALGTAPDLQKAQGQLADLRAAADRAERQAAALEKSLSAAQSALSAAEATLSSAQSARDEAMRRRDQDRSRLAGELSAAGLFLPGISVAPVPEGFLTLSLDDLAGVPEEAELARLEQEIRQFEAALRAARERLDSLRAELDGQECPDTGAMQQNLDGLRRRSRELSERLGSLRQSGKAADEAAVRLQELSEQGTAAESEYMQAGRLAQLLSGKNPRKVPIQQFVLGVMLDDVLSSANQFFSMFSRGRYGLQRTEDTRGNNLGGLDLEVLDAQTGAPRSIETLSGGEQFLASLSLAFGLSDVVQRYSGSVRLDSIFIDEGFGSLDQETLDTAMRALAQIRSAGRTIGIISHVTELKRHIAPRIEVSAAQGGGSTAVVVCGQ